MLNQFYKSKKVLVTGHTGFKGTWLSQILIGMGAEVTGYALAPNTTPALFDLAGMENRMHSVIGDVRDFAALQRTFAETQPDLVFHLAAQPIVRESYRTPRETYETNVMGTVNVLECVRQTPSVKSFLNVTTDKVYQNDETGRAFVESDKLDGFDPYSNSKSCSELVTHSYRSSFFADGRCAISTARAGNVIGGGDFAADRIIPDCVRAITAKRPIEVRNPHSTRPYQHVLEPLFAYLMIAAEQWRDPAKAGWYNVGPDTCDCVETGELVQKFCDAWGEGAAWINRAEANAPHEANFLKLSTERIKSVFGWSPRWHVDECIRKVCEFSRVWCQGKDVAVEMDREIREFAQ